VDLKVTFSQQNTLNIYIKKKKAVWDCQCGLIIKWNQPTKKLLEESGNNRFHKSGNIILTLNMVKSHFSFISYTDIVQVFQSMFSDDMIANKWPLENRSMLFGSLWNPSIFDGINQKKDKYVYVLLFDESLIQQHKKKQLDIQATCILELSYKFK
jgi:hypothetical protein